MWLTKYEALVSNEKQQIFPQNVSYLDVLDIESKAAYEESF